MTAPPLQVAPGVHRLSVPLPFPPREVAAWVIDGPDGHVLVDTGIDTAAGREALLGGAEHLGVTPDSLGWVLLTHAHIDHYGLAGPVRAWAGAQVAMHERDEELARRFVDRWPEDRALVGRELAAGGVPEAAVPQLLAASDFIHRQYRWFRPDVLLRGDEGDVPGAPGWRWILTPGHSPGHVVVHHPERRILIAGDHVLPRISPNIGADLYASDPLSDYLASLRRLRELPVDLVLPSHGEPFTDFAARVDAIAAHHDQRAAQVLALLGQPRSPYDATVAVFGELPPQNMLHAYRETLAHLVYLERTGAARRTRDAGLEHWTAA
ncbi:MAG: Zn-dependent hydrolase including glyoxylase-like protein [Gemmatimonadetes bacterium]|nr:Zn-dependent hydrolase including glyoxylase-like protein [Gemmatimonadota bacterium]